MLAVLVNKKQTIDYFYKVISVLFFQKYAEICALASK